MIRPIQPVSCYYASPVLSLCNERVRLLACLSRKTIDPNCFTVLMGIRRQDFCIHSVNLATVTKTTSESVPHTDRWQPWPARPAYADEVTRWWPSDEKPAIQDVVPVNTSAPDSDLVFIPVPVQGSLLNLSA